MGYYVGEFKLKKLVTASLIILSFSTFSQQQDAREIICGLAFTAYNDNDLSILKPYMYTPLAYDNEEDKAEFAAKSLDYRLKNLNRSKKYFKQLSPTLTDKKLYQTADIPKDRPKLQGALSFSVLTYLSIDPSNPQSKKGSVCELADYTGKEDWKFLRLPF